MTTLQNKHSNPIAHLRAEDIEELGRELDEIRQQFLDARGASDANGGGQCPGHARGHGRGLAGATGIAAAIAGARHAGAAADAVRTGSCGSNDATARSTAEDGGGRGGGGG